MSKIAFITGITDQADYIGFKDEGPYGLKHYRY
jgi:hypothetical protein